MNWFKRLFGLKDSTPKTTETPTPKKEFKRPPLTRPVPRTVHTSRKTSDDDFVTSMVVAEVTDSATLGYMAGGNLMGAIIGDALNDSDNHHSYDHHSTDSYDSYDSSDSSSSYDSSDSYSSSDW
jgi:hypothetical protein